MENKKNDQLVNLGKTTARLLALQILYSENFDEKVQQEILFDEYIEKYKVGEIYSDMVQKDDAIIEPDEHFLKELLVTTQSNLENIDANIKQFLKSGWTIDKIDPVVKVILRLAVCELLFFGDIPHKVIIDQYVSLVSDFYINQEIGFVNAMLDALAKKIRVTVEKIIEVKL